ncbi:unnamed protein product [Alopecurus aequalis]
MARLVSARTCPSQRFQVRWLPSIRPPLNSHSATGSRDPTFRGVKLSNPPVPPGFVAAALEVPKSAPHSPGPENRLPSEEVIRTWCNADAVCFDVDSTVCLDEGIDELADFCGAGQAVAEWTAKAMTGSVAFEDALAARLSLFKPSLYQINECMEKRPPRISPGIAKLIKTLRAKNVDLYLVSGGFRQMFKVNFFFVHPSVVCEIFFHTRTVLRLLSLASPLTDVPLCMQKYGYNTVVMIGDGATDLEARQPGSAGSNPTYSPKFPNNNWFDLFICYGEVQMREAVAGKADWVVSDFLELITKTQI